MADRVKLNKISPLRLIMGEIRYAALFAVLLFVPARTLAWPRAWILLAILFMVRTLGVLSVRSVNEDLLAERSKIPLHRDQPLTDKLLLPVLMLSFAALVAFIPLDRFHLHIVSEPAFFVSMLGLVAFTGGWILVAAALRTNAFATTVVRPQADRQQHVVDEGVYSVVRHPMYAGLIPVMVGMSLWLGSIAAVILSVVPIVILIGRIILEERVLRIALPGYEEYSSKVSARLIPHVW